MWVQGSPPHVNIQPTSAPPFAHATPPLAYSRCIACHYRSIPRTLASSISEAPTTRRSTGVLSSVHPLCIPVRLQVSAERAQRTGGAGSDRRTLVTCQPASAPISDAHPPTCSGGNIPAIPCPSHPRRL
ncbi:hypothetical protein HETIRDRAFT_455110 [Heterobasidion irregulare TC 32-1]|uniref:Uncharacterized protein n=1 Tax=Heterobasidion irregulare (strain TC 32-1) TaxID=747525 RepID=W4JSP1_HETIT|nr:uncharacterized protein HETIRDRAFT_455110 [Heterobasidion irregulare TC 32-1]ETW76582.1 hypothetical protein HETIRDRAFT_455110 [Heterobasidion irregulare TC 32-1]